MINKHLFSFAMILFVSLQGCKMKSYFFSAQVAEFSYEVVISSNKKPSKTNENTFLIHPDDYIFIQQPCGIEKFDPVIVKGEFSLGMVEEWGNPYITRNHSIYFCIRDFACPEVYSDSVYHWTDKFYLQIKGCSENPKLESSGLVFNISEKIAFCK